MASAPSAVQSTSAEAATGPLGHLAVPVDNEQRLRAAVRLGEVDPGFSFSAFLSPASAGRSWPFGTITYGNNTPLDAVHLIELALNEECRALARGCFYHLPLRQEADKGHPCDLVFVDEPWGPTSRTAWDHGNWQDRLDMCDAEAKIVEVEYIIPVCCRILKFDSPENAAPGGGNYMHTYASHSDPAIAKHSNILAFSRPLDNKGRVLIAYRHQHAKPHLYVMDSVEHEAVSSGFLTPDDLSETFVPHYQATTQTVFGRKSESPPPRPTNSPWPLKNHVACNRDVVLSLLKTWNGDKPLAGIPERDQKHIKNFVFKQVRCMWQEVKGRIALTQLELANRKKMVERMNAYQPGGSAA